MAKVEQKKTIVEEISEHIKDAQSVVLVTYSGITVEQDTALRKEMREAGVVYKVYSSYPYSCKTCKDSSSTEAGCWCC